MGRLVLITGASDGIGRVSAEAFVASGDRVIGVARSIEKLTALAEQLGGAAHFVPVAADVTDGDAMDEMARGVLEDHGVPDVVVANAGVGLDALFCEMTDEQLHRVFDVNVYGVVRTVRPFLKSMLERGSGRILLVSSIVGKRGIPHYTAYSASKFAVQGMAEALRTEIHGSGVTVGVICPASTTTAFADNALRSGPAQVRKRPRRHSPESVAHAIVKMSRTSRREVILGVEAKLLTLVSRLAPGLVDHYLARYLTR